MPWLPSLFSYLEICIHRVNGHIAWAIGAKDQNEEKQCIPDCPALPGRAGGQAASDIAAPLLENAHRQKNHGGHAHNLQIPDAAQGGICQSFHPAQNGIVFAEGLAEVRENPAQHIPGHGHIVGAEDDLAQYHQERRPKHLKQTEGLVLRGEVQRTVDPFKQRCEGAAEQDQHEVIQSEEHIMPGRSVPQAVAKPDTQQCNGPRNQGAEVVAQLLPGDGGQLLQGRGHGDGVEDIVPEPGAQGDVPPGPEFGDVFGEEGAAKILRHGQPKDLGRAADRVHGAGKVGIELQGVENAAHQGHITGVGVVPGKQLLHHGIQAVRNDQFFHQTEGNTLEAQAEVFIGNGFCLPEGPGGVAVAADGALHNAGEKA